MFGPHRERRPDSPIANAVVVARLATHEAEEQYGPSGRLPEGSTGPGAPAERRGPRRHVLAGLSTGC